MLNAQCTIITTASVRVCEEQEQEEESAYLLNTMTTIGGRGPRLLQLPRRPGRALTARRVRVIRLGSERVLQYKRRTQHPSAVHDTPFRTRPARTHLSRTRPIRTCSIRTSPIRNRGQNEQL